MVLFRFEFGPFPYWAWSEPDFIEKVSRGIHRILKKKKLKYRSLHVLKLEPVRSKTTDFVVAVLGEG